MRRSNALARLQAARIAARRRAFRQVALNAPLPLPARDAGVDEAPAEKAREGGTKAEASERRPA